MYYSIKALTAVLLCLVFTAPVLSQQDAAADRSAVESLVHANTLFASDLYLQLSHAEGNLFFSPYSIAATIGMTAAGARGNTAAEMLGALHTSGMRDPHSAYGELDRLLQSTAVESGQTLYIANGLCLTGGRVDEEFRSLLHESYHAAIFNGGAGEINEWVRTRTDGRIENIMERMPSNTVCVLLNAISFKGSWKLRFDSASTRDARFQLSPGAQMLHPFMRQRGRFRLLEHADFRAVSLPYRGDHMSMVMVLPRETNGLAALESTLTAKTLTRWLTQLDGTSPRVIDLSIPKFKLASGYDLVSACRNLGMNDAFLPDVADFSGMGWPAGDLWIGQIKHKAFVDVNEEGTEAAAVTGIGMQTKSASRYPLFHADHPFLFLIRDNRSGSILFMGRLSRPEA